ncbi:MAG: macro domain-containing protein [Clostridiales bacterium]|nr:macro domain-containing protein [Candidatus Crickella equi]
MIEIMKIGITELATDAIVNAANEGLREGSGVCGAIFRAAGSADMTKACKAIGHCPTGGAVITPGFRLAAAHVIHTVGPIYKGGKTGEPEQLYSAYHSSLDVAKENGLHSIAFPLISAGIFGYPLEQAWEIALGSCKDWLAENDGYEMQIVFAVLDDKIMEMGMHLLARS